MASQNPLHFSDPIPDAPVPCKEARARDNAKEGPLVVPDIQTRAQYRPYWKGSNLPAQASNLYGTLVDHKWEFNTDKKEWQSSEPKPLAIQGAIDWPDVWTHWDGVGVDYKLKGTKDDPLHPNQTDMMDKYCDVTVAQFEKYLGRGHYGGVYQVRYQRRRVKTIPSTGQPSTSQQVQFVWGPEWEAACKVMKMDEHGDEKHPIEGEVEYLLQDIQTLRYLKHENIVQMLDVVHIPDTETRFPFSTVLLLMELCHGDLSQVSKVCDKTLVPLVVVKKMMRNVSSGLKFMHNQNMVHFDIKPKNILFRWSPQKWDLTMYNLVKHLDMLTFKIGDLGLCETYDEGQPAVINRRIGTEMYMSPEIAALGYKAGQIKAKPCDIYSLGVTLAFCVTQDQTFNLYVRNDKLLDYMESIENMPKSQIPEGITRSIASLICQLIQRDPNDRHS